MKTLLLGLLLFAGQMITLQEKPVVHLPPNKKIISTDFGGSLLELINVPSVVTLPVIIPKLDAHGLPWSLDVKNMGPNAVTIIDKAQFSLLVRVGQTVHIHANGTTYSSPETPLH